MIIYDWTLLQWVAATTVHGLCTQNLSENRAPFPPSSVTLSAPSRAASVQPTPVKPSSTWVCLSTPGMYPSTSKSFTVTQTLLVFSNNNRIEKGTAKEVWEIKRGRIVEKENTVGELATNNWRQVK